MNRNLMLLGALGLAYAYSRSTIGGSGAVESSPTGQAIQTPIGTTTPVIAPSGNVYQYPTVKAQWLEERTELFGMQAAAKAFRVKFMDPITSQIAQLNTQGSYIRSYPGTQAQSGLNRIAYNVALLKDQLAPYQAQYATMNQAIDTQRGIVAGLRRQF